MVKDCPAQIVPPFAAMVGVGITETCTTVAEALLQPNDEVPVTEYEVVVAGLTVKVPPVIV